MIHVSRAGIDGISKDSTNFDFPLEIDLRKITFGTSMIYSLQSVIAQSGTARCGHYISYMKNGMKWLEANDTVSKKVNSAKIKSLNGESNFAATSLLYVLK